MSQQPVVARPSWRSMAPVALFVVVAVAALVWAKWWPYGHKLGGLAATRHWSGGSPLAAAGAPGAAPSWQAAWRFAVSYGQSVWAALVAALLIAAGVEVLLPGHWLGALARRRGWAASALAGCLSVPFMMCTCCTAPIANSLRRQGVRPGAVAAFWLGNPLLNPAVLAFLVLVLPWHYAVIRLGVGLLLVFGLPPLLERIGPGAAGEQVAGGRQLTAAVGADEPAPTRPSLVGYLRALGRLAVVLVPEYLAVVLLLGALRGWLLPLTHPGPTVLYATLLAAVAGTLLVIPTAGEIPIIAGLSAAGFAPEVTGALLIALPAVSLPSMVMVSRALTWRRTIATAVAVCVAALLGAAVSGIW